MPQTESSQHNLVAPCGMNCGVCIAFLREKNKCPGCRYINVHTSKYRLNCRIRNCEQITGESQGFCYNCSKPFCLRMKQLDKRYRTSYNTSLIGNLQEIRTKGMVSFLRDEKVKWTCKHCGNIISVHRGYCLSCEKK